jgi:hypothetical protein
MDLQQQEQKRVVVVPVAEAEDLAPGEIAITVGADGVVNVEQYIAHSDWVGAEIDSKGTVDPCVHNRLCGAVFEAEFAGPADQGKDWYTVYWSNSDPYNLENEYNKKIETWLEQLVALGNPGAAIVLADHQRMGCGTHERFARTQKFIGYLRTAIANHNETNVVRPHAYYLLATLLKASASRMP